MLFSICCGFGPEERKARSFEAPSESWGYDKKDSTRIDSDKRRIRRVESQIAQFNRLRPRIRQTVCSKPVQLSASFRPPTFEKSPEQFQFLKDAICDNFIFSNLNDEELDAFVGAMKEEWAQCNDVICKQGDPGDYFYVVEKGTVEFLDGTEVVGTGKDGDSFGELALLFDSPRAVSCVAVSPIVQLWKVDQLTFRYLLAHANEHRCACIKGHIKDINIFQGMDDEYVMRLVHAMTPVQWKAGDRIVQKGEKGDIFYLIQEGEVKVHDIGLGDSTYEDQILGAGQAFGERALLTGEPRVANVTALSNVLTLAMDRETFESSIGPLKDILERDMRKKFLSTLPLFAHRLSDLEIDQLAGLLSEVCYPRGHRLAEAGRTNDVQQLWIIRHGRLLVYDNDNPDIIFDLESGDHFGDDSVRNADPNWTSSLTAVCEDNVTAWVLTRADIEHVIGDLKRLHHAEPATQLVKSRHGPSILLCDLKKHRLLGMGAFGKVWLVSHTETSETYALKTISKRKLIESHQTQAVLREKELLQLLSHPFIIHLVSSFQDEDNLYILLPVVQGGELFSLLQKRKTKERGLPIEEAAFYSACVIEGLAHFHQLKVAYRDLKLENVLVDSDGYCVIVDLGFAKVVPDKTYTLVGTPEYLAPEVILSRGYDKAVDYWSFGVLLYELLVGHSPFYRKGSTQMEMFKRIVLVQYDLPQCVPTEASDMVKKLLVRRPPDRLGNLASGFIDVKSHSWFTEAGIKFSKILKKETEPPFKPTINDPLKLSSAFDNFSFAEDDKATGRKLTPSEQELFHDF